MRLWKIVGVVLLLGVMPLRAAAQASEVDQVVDRIVTQEKAEMEMLPLQKGDVPASNADVSALEAATGFRPRVTVEEGVRRFATWYRDYYSAH